MTATDYDTNPNEQDTNTNENNNEWSLFTLFTVSARINIRAYTDILGQNP